MCAFTFNIGREFKFKLLCKIQHCNPAKKFTDELLDHRQDLVLIYINVIT